MAATMMATPKSVTIVAAPIVSFLLEDELLEDGCAGLLGQEPGQGQAVAGDVEPGRTGELAGPDQVGHAVERAGELHTVVEDVIDVALDLEDRPQDPVEEQQAHGCHHGDE